MKQKSRILCIFMICSVLISLCCILPNAEQANYSWYCVHVKDHKQPTVGSDLSFAEDFGSFFIDHAHTDWADESKQIYLTFDVGYENGNVGRVLDILREEEVYGNFFIVGTLIRREPELVKRMQSEGHTVGNHTMNHPNLGSLSEAELLQELQEPERLFLELTGSEMSKFYRPPEGRFSRETLSVGKENGYQAVFWSFAYPDWDNNRQMSFEKAKCMIWDNLHNGEIMLLHPTSNINVELLRDLICELKAQGYHFGRLEELNDVPQARN